VSNEVTWRQLIDSDGGAGLLARQHARSLDEAEDAVQEACCAHGRGVRRSKTCAPTLLPASGPRRWIKASLNGGETARRPGACSGGRCGVVDRAVEQEETRARLTWPEATFPRNSERSWS